MKNYYENPILSGDYPDPSIIREGQDYYMTHSTFEYGPALLIWHSRNLIDWTPVCNAVNGYTGNVFAPELVKHDGIYYIYYPAYGTNYVVYSKNIEGPYSDPIDLKILQHIDPGHCVDDNGNRYLYVSSGNIVKLSNDGLSSISEPEVVYTGWQFPEEWIVQGFCLESPKITKKNGYYYLTVAQGGTAGPATSHMIVSARSKSPFGPFENSPYNPIVHTESSDEKWWSKGHGTLIDTPDGDWYILYHGYEKGFHTLGRQTLMEPIEWTDDGWFKIKEGIETDKPIKRPEGEEISSSISLSDTFKTGKLGLHWRFYKEYDPNRFNLTENGITLNAKGSSLADTSPLVCVTMHKSYKVKVKMTVEENTQAGLTLFYNNECFCGICADDTGIFMFNRVRRKGNIVPKESNEIYLYIENDAHCFTAGYSFDNINFHRIPSALDISGYHHNTFREFISLRAGIYATGSGSATFSDFEYIPMI